MGDPTVPNVDYSTGFSDSTDDISDVNPSGYQLYNSNSGCVYDSVVYEAFGGLGDLVRRETKGVTHNGYPWIGGAASGTDSSGNIYTMGRYPDGLDTHFNFDDFNFMPASPGASNGDTVSLGTNYTFDTVPSKAFKTFQAFSVGASGVTASPSGGNVHRCIDTTGGGCMSVFGDASLGSDGNGYDVKGEVYFPSSTEPVQANGFGFCGKQGTAFFTGTAYEGPYAYESGYWLIYENASGANINDGRADHPGVVEFVWATNDNMDDEKVTLLGSATLASLGVSAGSWSEFYLAIDPNASASEQLIAKINNTVIFQGAIPVGGPISGAVQFGFRENHSGAPASNEGTWVDNLTIGNATKINNWVVY